VAVPTAYTEEELADFMRRQLRGIADELGWSVTETGGDYTDAIVATLDAYGVADLTLATDAIRLRALARREVWRAAVDGLADRIDQDLSGQNLKLSQMYKQAKERLVEAEIVVPVVPIPPEEEDLSGLVGTIGVGKVVFPYDPYRPTPEADEFAR
jgi:hypothetical protein